MDRMDATMSRGTDRYCNVPNERDIKRMFCARLVEWCNIVDRHLCAANGFQYSQCYVLAVLEPFDSAYSLVDKDSRPRLP